MIRMISCLIVLTISVIVSAQEPAPVSTATPPAVSVPPETPATLPAEGVVVTVSAVPADSPDEDSEGDSEEKVSPDRRPGAQQEGRFRRNRNGDRGRNGDRDGDGNRPPRGARVPRELFGEETEESPRPEDTLLGGSTPAIWEIERSNPILDDENLPSILERDTAVPTVPGKVVRYAVWLMQHYDTDGDGVLREEEWKKMPGSPQAMDINGDSIVTLDELVRFLALYGQERTIHRPNPVPRFYQPTIASSQFQIFKPVSAPPPTPTVQTAPPPEKNDSEGTEKAEDDTPFDPSVDQTEESLEAADEPIVDDETYEKIFAKHGIPAARRYHTPSEALRGVPAWFLLLDRDGDGQVSLLEFAPTLSARALALFGKLDQNGDGFIMPDEVRKPLPSEDPPGPE